MKAINNDGLVNDLHYGPECVGFEPALKYKNDTEGSIFMVNDASVFPSNDGFDKVIVHVYDTKGNKASGVITEVGGSVKIDTAKLDKSNISATATVISTGGCKADLGIYNLLVAGDGVFGNVSIQGKRN